MTAKSLNEFLSIHIFQNQCFLIYLLSCTCVLSTCDTTRHCVHGLQPKILSQNNNNIVNSSLHNLIFLLIFQKEMEEISFRFPHILELILRYLDNLSLVRCALVNKTWSLIIQNGKQLGIRMIQHYIGPNWKLKMGSGQIIS